MNRLFAKNLRNIGAAISLSASYLPIQSNLQAADKVDRYQQSISLNQNQMPSLPAPTWNGHKISNSEALVHKLFLHKEGNRFTNLLKSLTFLGLGYLLALKIVSKVSEVIRSTYRRYPTQKKDKAERIERLRTGKVKEEKLRAILDLGKDVMKSPSPDNLGARLLIARGIQNLFSESSFKYGDGFEIDSSKRIVRCDPCYSKTVPFWAGELWKHPFFAPASPYGEYPLYRAKFYYKDVPFDIRIEEDCINVVQGIIHECFPPPTVYKLPKIGTSPQALPIEVEKLLNVYCSEIINLAEYCLGLPAELQATSRDPLRKPGKYIPSQ
jgi:hypothetical protein